MHPGGLIETISTSRVRGSTSKMMSLPIPMRRPVPLPTPPNFGFKAESAQQEHVRTQPGAPSEAVYSHRHCAGVDSDTSATKDSEASGHE